jgi:hypothetical protein
VIKLRAMFDDEAIDARELIILRGENDDVQIEIC